MKARNKAKKSKSREEEQKIRMDEGDKEKKEDLQKRNER